MLIVAFLIPAQVTLVPKYLMFYKYGLTGSPLATWLPALLGQGVNSSIFVLVFYLFRGEGWQQRLSQLAGLLLLNGALLAGQTVPLFGLPLPVQSFAVLALAPIWLYRGRQGPHGRAVRWLFYGFYPAHLLVLAAAAALAN